MENLPDDVLSNIFIRLQAKQLAQMRCISKAWNTLLSQSSLVKSHLNRSVHNNDGILFVFSNLFRFDSKSFTVYPSRSPHIELTNFIKLPFNSQSNQGRGKVIGSVNGLICFSYGSDPESEAIYIWNPSLSAFVTLPPYSKSPHFDNWITSSLFGFGFDPKTDDYKVFKFTEGVNVTNKNNDLFSARKCLQIEVYSMQKGSWKLTSQNIRSHLTWVYDHDHICLHVHHANLHWLGKTDFEGNFIQVIVAFNLGTEMFHEIPLPDSIRDHDVISNYLGVLGGKLCVMSTNPLGECEVWVMDEYNVAKSWVKDFVFPLPPFSGGDFKLHGLTLRDEFFFRVKSRGVALYDLIVARTKYLGFCTGCKVVEYFDSLVWVTPPKKSERVCRTSFLKRFLHSILGWFWNLFKKKG